MKNNKNWMGAIILFLFVLSVIANGFLASSGVVVVKEKQELLKQLSTQKIDFENLRNSNTEILEQQTNKLQEQISVQIKENKILETELTKKSKELLELNNKQRTNYEEQRAKWRNHAAGIMSELVTDLEHTARKCWDSDRDDFEDCIDDEFEDDSDQPINQVLNIA